jgi:hypothetical protein
MPVPNIPAAHVNSGGDQPWVVIFIGNAHWGKYEIWLRDPNLPPKRIGPGVKRPLCRATLIPTERTNLRHRAGADSSVRVRREF